MGHIARMGILQTSSTAFMDYARDDARIWPSSLVDIFHWPAQCCISTFHDLETRLRIFICSSSTAEKERVRARGHFAYVADHLFQRARSDE